MYESIFRFLYKIHEKNLIYTIDIIMNRLFKILSTSDKIDKIFSELI